MKRVDSRKPGELRPVEVKAGVIEQANGSAMVRMGRTIAIAAVYGPREMHPRRMVKSERAFLKTIYRMAPFSTTDRCRPGPSRRSQEISMVTREALEAAVFLDEFPKTGIYVFIDILQADAGTRTAGINAASVALADAGIPMRDLVTAVAAGKVGSEYLLDLEYKEEEETAADLPIAYMPRLKKITLLQMDGDLPVKDVKAIMQSAIKGCEIMYEKQKQALRERWDIKAAGARKAVAKPAEKKAAAPGKEPEEKAKPAEKKAEKKEAKPAPRKAAKDKEGSK
jgi:exosome complex component RRP41